MAACAGMTSGKIAGGNTYNADQLRTADGPEEPRPEIQLRRPRGDAVRLWHRHGCRPDGRAGARLRQRGHAKPAVVEGGADLRVRRGLGSRPRRDESEPRDGGRWRARHHLPQAARDGCEDHRRLQRARRLRQGQGQGRGDQAPDRAGRREGREARHPDGIAFRARRRRLRRPVRRPARAARGPGARAGQVGRHFDATRPGADLSPVRRPQSAALRSGIRQEGRLPAADPARHVHLRHHLPRRAADLRRL